MRICPNYEVNPIDVAGLYNLEKSLFVMVHLSRMVAPILIYIAIPIAFPEHADSGLLDIVFFSEVRNYNGTFFISRIIEALKKRRLFAFPCSDKPLPQA